MPKNKKGGKNAKKQGNKYDSNVHIIEKLPNLEKDQQFALLVTNKGDCRFDAVFMDGITRVCHVPGSFRKKIWFKAGDYVLSSPRSFEPSKADIEMKISEKLVNEVKDKYFKSEEKSEEEDFLIDFEEI